MFCGSSFKNKGVQPLLDGVIDFLPSPTDIPSIAGIDVKTGADIERHASDDEPLSMLAFKIANDPHMGSLTFCRIYSGHVNAGDMLENTVKEKKERVGRMFQMHSNSREQINEAYAGDIVAIVGLKDTTTGDTLSDPTAQGHPRAHGVPGAGHRHRGRAEVQGRPGEDGPRAGSVSLPRIRASASRPTRNPARPSSRAWANFTSTSSSTACARVQGRSQYRCAAGGLPRGDHPSVEHDYTHKKQSGGSGQFARIKFRIEPNEPGAGFEFKSEVVGGNVPKEYVPGVEKGVASVMGAGPIIGFPIVDVKFVLTDGAYHDVDSSVLAFEIAGRAGFREAIEKAAPKILEPIMRVEVLTPEDYVGDVIGDLNSRRGQIRGTEGRGIAQVIDAMVPLANMFGYVNSLRSMSQGRAQYTMTFDHYEQVPNAVATGSPGEVRLTPNQTENQSPAQVGLFTETSDGQGKVFPQ